VMMAGLRSLQSSSADVEVVLGVDTHLDFHVAVALEDLGRRLGALRLPTTTKGYKKLLSCALCYRLFTEVRRRRILRRLRVGDTNEFMDVVRRCGT
jgi:hypothetical protein